METPHEERLDTQQINIQVYLEKGNSITPIDALNMFGSFRLAAHIHTLRTTKGMNILGEMEQGDNGKRYKRYWLEKDM